MLIDLTKHFVEILPHISPSTLVVRAMDTETFGGELEWTSDDFKEPQRLAPDASSPSSMAPIIWEGPGGSYYGDGPGQLMEWRIRQPGSYWIGSARWELPQPDKERESIKFRASQILFSPGAVWMDLITELQADPESWGHVRVYVADFNPNSEEPLPLSGEVSVQPRSVWERLNE